MTAGISRSPTLTHRLITWSTYTSSSKPICLSPISTDTPVLLSKKQNVFQRRKIVLVEARLGNECAKEKKGKFPTSISLTSTRSPTLKAWTKIIVEKLSLCYTRNYFSGCQMQEIKWKCLLTSSAFANQLEVSSLIWQSPWKNFKSSGNLLSFHL